MTGPDIDTNHYLAISKNDAGFALFDVRYEAGEIIGEYPTVFEALRPGIDKAVADELVLLLPTGHRLFGRTPQALLFMAMAIMAANEPSPRLTATTEIFR